MFDGPSPRVRGKRYSSRAADSPTSGPSPRVRGKLPERLRSHAMGSIPARAGETLSLTGPRLGRSGVHPRACGGNMREPPRQAGVHPRACGGNVIRRERRHAPRWVHPRACGGNTPTPRDRGDREGVHPRACGGNGSLLPRSDSGGGPSPRVRGKLVRHLEPAGLPRSIPARAGETGRGERRGEGMGVHPRACGGNGRGYCGARGGRSIPARAGETLIVTENSQFLRRPPRTPARP